MGVCQWKKPLGRQPATYLNATYLVAHPYTIKNISYCVLYSDILLVYT